MDMSKFQNKLQCVCNDDVIFEIIDEIECDECPRCND